MRKHQAIPDDDRRCQHTTIDGRRCTYPRLEGDQTLCWPHYDQMQSRAQKMAKMEPPPAFVAQEILPPEQALDSAQAVNATLTRVFRCLIEGRLTPRHAAALGYLSQLIISTLPGMTREAESTPAHNLLGRDPDAALDQLAHSLQRSLATAVAPAPSPSPSSTAIPSSVPSPAPSPSSTAIPSSAPSPLPSPVPSPSPSPAPAGESPATSTEPGANGNLAAAVEFGDNGNKNANHPSPATLGALCGHGPGKNDDNA